MTGPGPYPTYTENPYDGGVDQVVPTDAIASSGLAALAAKTQQDWQEELFGAFDTTLNPLSDLLGKLFDLFSEFVDIDGFVEIASDVLGFFYNLLDRAGFFTLLEGGAALFEWLTELGTDAIEALVKPIIELLQWLFDFITDLISVEDFKDLIDKIVTALNSFLSANGFADLLSGLLKFFNTLFTDSWTDFVGQLPTLAQIVAAITGKTTADGIGLDLGALQTYFRDLDDKLGDGIGKLVAAAEKLLGGTISVSQVADVEKNLLSQGDFLTSSTVDPANGWSWDSTRTRTGSGGSLKVVCTGSSQRIYCLQDIKVAAGDRLSLSGYVGTNSFTSGSMQLSLVPWAPVAGVMTAQTVQNGTARTTSANTFQALPTLNYTVPSGVTSIQVSLVVNCNSGAEVFFDDISLKKTGVLGQTLVTNLIDAFNGILAGAGYTFGTGWTFLQTAVGLVTGTANDASQNIEDTNLVLFNNPETGTLTDAGGRLGTVINPASASGAVMTRTSTTPVSASGGRNPFSVHSGFFGNGSSGSGITANTTTATFSVSTAGWYLAEISFRLGTAGTTGFNAAPLLYKNGLQFKIGSDGIQTATRTSRYSQSSFIVYLGVGETVSAGYDVDATTGTPQFIADASGVETYFSVSLLNKTFA